MSLSMTIECILILQLCCGKRD